MNNLKFKFQNYSIFFYLYIQPHVMSRNRQYYKNFKIWNWFTLFLQRTNLSNRKIISSVKQILKIHI